MQGLTREDVFQACTEALEELRNNLHIPWDTGNLATNALRYYIEGNEFIIEVNEEIAPYMVYTNEPWEEKDIRMGNFKKGETVVRHRTWKNPNEGWWQRWVEDFMALLAEKVQGELIAE